MYKNEPLVPWKQDEPHIYTRWWLCLYLWLYASEINYRTEQASVHFFCERSLPEKETFWFADERRSIKDCSLKHLQPKEKESVFLGHLKKRNIYTFYKVSTDRFHTRGQQLWFFFFWAKEGFTKEKGSIPKGLFLVHQYGHRFLIVVYTNMAAMRSMWKRSIQ